MNRGLKRETDSSYTESTNDLNGSEIALSGSSSSVTNHQTKREDLDAESENNDWLEVANVSSDDTGEGCRESRNESSEGGDSSGRKSRLVGSDEDVGVAGKQRIVSSAAGRKLEDTPKKAREG